MLGQANDERLAFVRALFEQLLSEEIEDLDILIRLGQLEMLPPQED